MNPSLADPDRLRVGVGVGGVFKGDIGYWPSPLIFGALDALIGGGGAVRAEGTAMGGIGGHCTSSVQGLHLATAIVM